MTPGLTRVLTGSGSVEMSRDLSEFDLGCMYYDPNHIRAVVWIFFSFCHASQIHARLCATANHHGVRKKSDDENLSFRFLRRAYENREKLT
jgi:hypothetical protein